MGEVVVIEGLTVEGLFYRHTLMEDAFKRMENVKVGDYCFEAGCVEPGCDGLNTPMRKALKQLEKK